MKLILLVTATAVALSASPALADKGGHGHGNGGKEWKHSGDRDDESRGKQWSRGGDQNDDREDREDREDRGDRGNRVNYGYNGGSSRHCPPGLAKKHNGCTPPGQYRQSSRWSQGDQLPNGYRSYTPYSDIPQRYIDQYHLDPNSRYVYRDNTLYQVNPQTMIIQQILRGLTR